MFTQEKLDELHGLMREFNSTKVIVSEQIKTARDRFGERVQKDVPRPDGSKQDLKENVMWEEVFYLGIGCESGKILASAHPEVFKAHAAQEKLGAELQKFCINEFGFDFKAMTISDYVSMTEQIVDLKLEERGFDRRSPLNAEDVKQ